MRNDKLVELNFKHLIHYHKLPPVQCKIDPPLKCSDFCTSCEENQYLRDRTQERFLQISHGLDTSDYESMYGELSSPFNDTPVMFLLESPGGSLDNSEECLNQKDFSKYVPTKHYYWTAENSIWPKSLEDLGHLYGPYFAYIVKKYRLKNAYFTNVVKCSIAPKSKDKFINYKVIKGKRHADSDIRNNCYEKFLKIEIKVIKPELIFCFGRNTEKMVHLLDIHNSCNNIFYLMHPKAHTRKKDIVNFNGVVLDSVFEKSWNQ